MKSVKKFFIAISLFGLAISGCSRGKQSSSTNSDVRYAIYQLAVADGYEGTYQEWLASIKGEKGDTGAQGEPGKDGQDGHTPVITIGSDGYWYIDGDNTHVKAQGEKGDTGAQGPKGDAGSQGPKGDTGETGPQGPAGQNGTNGKDGTDGKDGQDGLTPYIGANGHWWIGDTDTGIAAQGPAGQDGTNGKDGRDGVDGQNGTDGANGSNGKDGVNGQDGLTPYIGSNGHWWIGDTDTGVAAQGPQGETGAQGPAGQNGKDGANGQNGQNGADGLTPYIGSNGNWWIGDVDTGVKAQGPAGQNGTNGTNGTNGQDGLTPYIGNNGHWWIGDTDTGVDAQGPQGEQGIQGPAGQDGSNGTNGQDGLTPYIGSNGNWWVGNTDTGVTAQGPAGQNGTNGQDGRSIVSIEKTGLYNLTDYYTITFSDGTTFMFYVTNGSTGQQGPAGPAGQTGEPGVNGQTAWSNTILPSQNGYITVNKGSAIIGEEITFTAIPDEHYYTSSFMVNGVECINSLINNSYTTTMSDNGYVVRGVFSVDYSSLAFSSEWSYNSSSHWRSCNTPGFEHLKTDEGEHEFDYIRPEGSYVNNGVNHYSCKTCGYSYLEETRHIEMAPVKENIVEATCRKQGSLDYVTYCATCGEELSREHIIIPASNHLLYNGVCTKCNEKLTDICENSLGVHYLSLYEKGQKYIEFYNAINERLKNAYNDLTNVLSDFSFNYSDYSLTAIEAINICDRINCEHPLYYFLSGNYSYNDETITMCVTDEYFSASARKTVQDEICTFLNNFGGEDIFDTLLHAHDYILDSVDYLYDGNGDPSDETFVHNIVGVIENMGAVCEGYAKSFQLVCDYCDIPSLMVTGSSNSQSHAWNIVEIDDEWYWVDTTWDDTSFGTNLPSYFLSGFGLPNYNYFLVSDSYFMRDHVLGQNNIALSNSSFMYAIENRSGNEYYANSNRTKLNSYFKSNSIVYQIVGYQKVSVANIDVDGVAYIPESVVYDNCCYRTISIGTYFEGEIISPNNGGYIYSQYGGNSSILVVEEKVTSLHIPKTIEYIYDMSLTSSARLSNYYDGYSWRIQNYLNEFVVDETNPFFRSIDGVLYTKDMKTLVAYPFGSNKTQYYLPDEVVYADDLVFSGIGSLELIVFNENYLDNGTLLNEASYCVGLNNGRIEIDDNNPWYYEENGIIYSCYYLYHDGLDEQASLQQFGSVIALSDVNRNTYTILDSFTKDNVIYYVRSFTVFSVTGVLPDGSIEAIQSSVFTYMMKVESIDCENDMFSFDGCCLYYRGQIIYSRRNLESISISNSISTLYFNNFYIFSNIKSITIPTSITRIQRQALSYLQNLEDIYYEGTIEQWYEIAIEQNWDALTGDFTIHCTNGDISKADFDSSL